MPNLDFYLRFRRQAERGHGGAECSPGSSFGIGESDSIGAEVLTQAQPLASSSGEMAKLEMAGVEFIPEDDLKGPNVRLKESTRSKARRKRRPSG